MFEHACKSIDDIPWKDVSCTTGLAPGYRSPDQQRLEAESD
jgi:hypothetical protein